MFSVPPKKDKSNVLLSLLNSLDAEIAYYRQRQVSLFREVAIVMALATWGAGRLVSTPEETRILFCLYIVASVACLAITAIGCKLIRNFRTRIHYARDRKTDVIKRIMESFPMEGLQLSYPTTKQRDRLIKKLMSGDSEQSANEKHYTVDQFEEIVEKTMSSFELPSTDQFPFTKEQVERLRDELNALAKPSSDIYIRALILVGVTTMIVNIAIALYFY